MQEEEDQRRRDELAREAEEKAREAAAVKPPPIESMLAGSPRKNLFDSFDNASTGPREPSDKSAEKLIRKYGWIHMKYNNKKVKIRQLTDQLRKRNKRLRELVTELLDYLTPEISSESDDQEWSTQKMQD